MNLISILSALGISGAFFSVLLSFISKRLEKKLDAREAAAKAEAGYVGQLCLVGQSDFSPYDVYICAYSDPVKNQHVWHKMCTTEAPP